MSLQIDARGPRWSAVITTIVLAIALVTSNLWVISFQAVVFAIGAIRGPQFTPYAFIFKKLIISLGKTIIPLTLHISIIALLEGSF